MREEEGGGVERDKERESGNLCLLLFCTFNTYSDFFKERERGEGRDGGRMREEGGG